MFSVYVCSTWFVVQFANPNGESPNMDPLSDSKVWFMPSLSEKDSEKELLERMGVEKNFKSPTKFSDISDSQLQSYAGILIPGGEHDCAFDCLPCISQDNVLHELGSQ